MSWEQCILCCVRICASAMPTMKLRFQRTLPVRAPHLTRSLIACGIAVAGLNSWAFPTAPPFGPRNSGADRQSEISGPTQGTRVDESSGSVAAETQPDPAAAQRARQVQVFGPILLNPSRDIDPQTRRDAARELLDMGTPEATRIIDSALRSRKASVMLAALAVLQTAPAERLSSYQEACLAAILDAPPETIEGLSVVLARMGNGTLNALADMAVNQNLPPDARVGPINALGAFRNRQAAGHLMSLLEGRLVQVPPPPRLMPEPLPVVSAACASLQRLTGLSFGRDPEAWRRWWSEVSALPTDQWYRVITQSLGERVAHLEAGLNKADEANDALSRQIYDTYRELYPALPVDEQLRRLPQLLEDKSPPVRMFALSRISLLLRDSVRIGPELQQKLAERLTDEVPDLRAQTARLLDELNYEGLAGLIATRLDLEQSPAVADVLFELATKRADIAMLPSIRRWLDDPVAGDDAAEAVWMLISITAAGDAELVQTRVELVQAIQNDPTAAQLRLLAFVADDSDMPAMEAVLDGPDIVLRRAVAEGLSRRGVRQPLIDRAADEAVYPFAVQSLTVGPADLDSLRVLCGLEPPEDERHVWADAVRTIAAGMPAGSLIAADDLLASTSWAGPRVRCNVLGRCQTLGADEVTAEQRLELTRRYAEALIEQGDAALAYEVMDAACADAVPALLASARFRAALLTNRFDVAANLQDQATAWIVVLDELATRDAAAVSALRREILRRFASELTDEQRHRLDQLSRLADGEATAAAAMDHPQPDSRP